MHLRETRASHNANTNYHRAEIGCGIRFQSCPGVCHTIGMVSHRPTHGQLGTFGKFHTVPIGLRLTSRVSQMCAEEGQHAPPILLARHLQGLVVLGALDQPELLGRPGQVEQGLGHCRLDVRVPAAVDHEQRTRRQAVQQVLQVRESADDLPC